MENYEVTLCGKIYKGNREIKQSKMSRGYLSVSLHNNGNSKTYYVHRVVAITYIPNPKSKPSVNHINGNKHDNRVSNLEWVTPQENSQHSVKILRKEQGERHSRAKIPDQVVADLRSGKITDLESVCEKYNSPMYYIKQVKSGNKRKLG